jgi:hypothetical protein
LTIRMFTLHFSSGLCKRKTRIFAALPAIRHSHHSNGTARVSGGESSMQLDSKRTRKLNEKVSPLNKKFTFERMPIFYQKSWNQFGIVYSCQLEHHHETEADDSPDFPLPIPIARRRCKWHWWTHRRSRFRRSFWLGRRHSRLRRSLSLGRRNQQWRRDNRLRQCHQTFQAGIRFKPDCAFRLADLCQIWVRYFVNPGKCNIEGSGEIAARAERELITSFRKFYNDPVSSETRRREIQPSRGLDRDGIRGGKTTVHNANSAACPVAPLVLTKRVEQ